MMKLTKHAWILWSVILAVVLVLACTIPFVANTVFWIGLLCIIAMFGVCALAFIRAFRKGNKLESKLLGWPIFKVGYVALIAQIIIGFVLMSVAALCPVWAAIIVEVLVFAAAAFCMTTKDAVREAVVAAETKVTNNTAAWKAIRARANAIAAQSDHPDLKKLAEEIRYADPTPTSIDGEIMQLLETLSIVADADSMQKAFAMLKERKTLAKAEK